MNQYLLFYYLFMFIPNIMLMVMYLTVTVVTLDRHGHHRKIEDVSILRVVFLVVWPLILPSVFISSILIWLPDKQRSFISILDDMLGLIDTTR